MKRLFSIIVAGLMAFSLVACGNEKAAVETLTSNEEISTVVAESTEEVVLSEETETISNDEVTESTSNDDVISENLVTYPITIIDQAEREVIIEKEPETLVSGYYISSSLLIALELEDKMVGIEAKADKRKIYKLAAEELIDLPSVGSAKEFDLEGCMALNADLIILPIRLSDAADTLDAMGFKTILVNPESEELLIEMIDILSTATNTVDRAEELKNFISDNTEMLSERLNNVEAKNVYLAGNSSVLSTAGSKMYQNAMIELAGGKNVAADIEEKYWVDIDYEQLLSWNPEYIIIAAEADYTVEDVLADETLSECEAVINGNVYKIPSNAEAWDSPVPSGILGSVWLAGALHSDVISSEEIDSIIEEFYETFYGFSYEK